MKKCFVIMPITTPDFLLTLYGGDREHFQHAYTHLFEPAVKAAEFECVPPKSEGAELIHADIVVSLQTADLVLCDMSILNANVFFELGIRTSLNKPICLIKDDKTQEKPFDTGILNFHTYKSGLHAWELEREVEALTRHVTQSAKKCAGKNPLWKHFGLTDEATAPETATVEDKLDLILSQLRSREPATVGTIFNVPHDFWAIDRDAAWHIVARALANEQLAIADLIEKEGNYVAVLHGTPEPAALQQVVLNLSSSIGLRPEQITFKYPSEGSHAPNVTISGQMLVGSKASRRFSSKNLVRPSDRFA